MQVSAATSATSAEKKRAFTADIRVEGDPTFEFEDFCYAVAEQFTGPMMIVLYDEQRNPVYEYLQG